MRQTPIVKPLPRPLPRPWLTATRAWLVGLGAIALVLLGLIGRETVFAKPAAAPLRLATVTRGTVKTQVSGTGSLVPAGQENVNFRVSGQITEIDVKVGDHVTTGQVLARLDASAQQAALSQAQASLAAAQASLQAAQTPLTAAQVAQLQHAVAAAQQNYTDTVNSVNAQNQADAAAVTADQQRYAADSCGTASPAPSCAQDQSQLTSDQSRQHLDQLSGQARVDQAAVQVTSAQDNLAVQTQAKPNAIASAQAQVASAAAQVQSAQVALNATTLTAPMSGVVVSINGQVGEMAPAGAGTTAQAPGTTAPQPSSSGSSAFMVVTDTSSFQAVIPFAETDSARLQPNQEASLTFDAIPGLTIGGHVLSTAPSATVVSSVVTYYATVVLNRTDPRLRAGMTANATVTVAQASNVLVVPNAAVHTTNGTTTVTVYSGGQQVSTEVETGLVGDTTTEIKSGLAEGDQVVLPSVRLSGTQRGGGTFGGGGIRVGGGGLRGGG